MFSQGGPADSTLSIGHGSKGIDELLQRSFSLFDYEHEFNFPTNIKNRDVADIPNYHFRDDGLVLWDAIRGYVKNVIDVFYQNDEDVDNDDELQKWEGEAYT